MLEMITPATNIALLTLDELRSAVSGVDGSSALSDADLSAMGLDAATQIAAICGVAEADSGDPPTLLRESLRETFWPHSFLREIVLARRFVTVTSVTENGVALSSGDYTVRSSQGIVQRLLSTYQAYWPCGIIVIEYDAGLATIPYDLKGVAADMVRELLLQTNRDPRLRSVTVEGVDSVTYYDGTANAASFDTSYQQRLSRFMNLSV